MPVNKLPTVPFLILSLSIMLCTSAQSQHYYSFYLPFDSTGVFKEKVVVPFDSTTFRVPAEVRKGSPTYLDSLSLEKIDYLANLLENNHKLVLRVLLYDDFYLSENHQIYGVNITYMRAKRVIRKVLTKGIETHSVLIFTIQFAFQEDLVMKNFSRRISDWSFGYTNYQVFENSDLPPYFSYSTKEYFPPQKRYLSVCIPVTRQYGRFVTGITTTNPDKAQNKPTLNFEQQCEQTLVFSI